MRFKTGKFYDDSWNEIPVQFGNKQQIKIIEDVQSMKNDGRVVPETVFTFKCFCGELHTRLFNEGSGFQCDCGAKYRFEFYEQLIPTMRML